jgi:hypothetical protein
MAGQQADPAVDNIVGLGEVAADLKESRDTRSRN